jgi:AraC-like DNA-binding protein
MAVASPPNSLDLSHWIRSCSALMTRHERFVATDFASTRQRILDFTRGRCSFTVTDSKRFIGFDEAHAHVGRIAVRFLRWDCDARCETETFRTPDHHVALHIPLSGSFEARQGDNWVTVEPGQVLVVSAAGTMQRRWEGRCDLLNLAVDREVVNRVASGRQKSAFIGQPLTVIDLARAATLARFIETIIHDLSSEEAAFSDTNIGLHAERILMLLLMRSMREKDSRPAPHEAPRVAPYYVRRAEQYMSENCMTRIEVSDLEQVSGVSARTLFYGFKQYRGASPMKYLKSVRLIRARRGLLEAQAQGGRVADIAAAVGYENKSQFARDYRSYFGETPTATLRGARG